MRPFSHSMPKQLIPIANKPILEHVLDNIRALQVTEIGLIVGDGAPAIAEAIGDGSRFGVRITYIRQDRPRGLAHCVRIARRFLGDDDFVMYLGDNVLPEGVTEMAARFRAGRPAAQVVVQQVADPRPFGVAELGEDGTVRRLVEKPQHPRSDLALIGVYFFTAAIHEAVAAIAPGARGELEITDAIQWSLSHGAEVRADEYKGYWKDAGRAEDVLECNRRLLSGLATGIAGQVDAASVVGDHVVIGEGARLVGSRVEGPAIIGANTLIENSLVGPNIAIGRDCVVRAANLSDSIVMDGASISRISGLYGSIIGRCAAIGPSDHDSAYHRLVVGDHTRMEIAA
ncbi:glucose-1-phosphate thymidylyltransferase [Actinomadura alba]